MGLEPGLRVERELSRKGWDLEKKESILTVMARGGRSQNEKKKKNNAHFKSSVKNSICFLLNPDSKIVIHVYDNDFGITPTKNTKYKRFYS